MCHHAPEENRFYEHLNGFIWPYPSNAPRFTSWSRNNKLNRRHSPLGGRRRQQKEEEAPSRSAGGDNGGELLVRRGGWFQDVAMKIISSVCEFWTIIWDFFFNKFANFYHRTFLPLLEKSFFFPNRYNLKWSHISNVSASASSRKPPPSPNSSHLPPHPPPPPRGRLLPLTSLWRTSP